MLRSWLQIQPAMRQTIMITEPLSFGASVVRNKLWYRGDADELLQMYRQLPGEGGRFWSSVPSNEQIRKLHSGIPALIVDTLAQIIKSDLSEAKFGDKENSTWNDIAAEIEFPNLVGQAVADCLVAGDGAFKISVDQKLSRFPLCEFYDAEHVDFDCRAGKITGIHFYTEYTVKERRTYTLDEHYTSGHVTYALYDGEKPVALNCVPELSDLRDVEFSGEYMMAVPMRFFDSKKAKGRGRSIYENKTDDFDALDEVISQWVDALRKGRVQRYIPDDLIPRDSKSGKMLRVSAFGADYITVQGSDSGEGQQVQLVQPKIDYQAYLSTYTTALDRCLQGILSPATLGIDLGKMASAEAQREKKDITGHTRNAVTGVLEKVLPKLIAAIMMTYDNMQGNTPGQYEATTGFGEYGAPDFDSRVDTVNKAATANTMSIETQVDEMWGDSKDPDWKAEEVRRIKQMRGVSIEEEPGVGDDLNDMG